MSRTSTARRLNWQTRDESGRLRLRSHRAGFSILFACPKLPFIDHCTVDTLENVIFFDAQGLGSRRQAHELGSAA